MTQTETLAGPGRLCGSLSGYAVHAELREKACPPCCAVRADYNRSRLVLTGRRKSLNIPVDALAVLLNAVPPETFALLRAALGPYTLDAVVELAARSKFDA